MGLTLTTLRDSTFRVASLVCADRTHAVRGLAATGGDDSRSQTPAAGLATRRPDEP
jgi:hypothetical protein